jgi:GH15 family glucan-1,4-alpha-glucosidase
MNQPSNQPPIGNYGIIGDLHTVALVGMDGSIDFMCFPRFDSPSIFAALLDREKGGYFRIAPVLENVTHKQLYLPDSVLLLTRFLAADGVAELSDFMPISDQADCRSLVRRVKTIRGDIQYRMICQPRFDYGRANHRLEQKKNEVLFVSEGPDKSVLRLRSSVSLRLENGAATAEFGLRSEQSASFVVEDASGTEPSRSSALSYVPDAFKQTMNFWQNWIRRSQYRGRWREVVDRAAMTLKLLASQPEGALVAAPTFGLPEQLGGGRNWDYRYTWIRDASFTLYALMRLGYTGEATAFMRWIEQRCRELEPGNPLQVLYGIDGRHALPESELNHFSGYRGSRPVRIGNDAHRQLQLDIYGELLDSVYIYNRLEPISYDFWTNLVQLIDWVCENWQRPDEGIWEVRGGAQEFLYSRVMCWVAVDRGIRLATKRSFPAPLDRWIPIRDQIYRDVYENFWDADLKTFVQYKGAGTVDASALLMPLVKFIGPNDPRWQSTLRVINEQLVEDSLVYRYHVLRGAADDGLPGREGTFSMCSFWNVECLARGGDVKQARFYFEKTLGYANHLGLFSEQIGPSGELLGNFPQAFTHLGLISAAWYLDRKLDAS